MTINILFSKSNTYLLALCCACCLLFHSTITQAQEHQHPFGPKGFKQFSMNITPLLVQLIPLNRSSIRTGPYNFFYKKIGKRGRGFRAAIGMNINDEIEDDSHLNIKIGWERMRKVNSKWRYSRGVDLVVFGGSFNTPSINNNSDDFGIGIGFSLGFEYLFSEYISLSTEATWVTGASGNSGFFTQVIPPVSVYFNVSLPKK